MNAPTINPLTAEQIARFHRDGYLFPIRVMEPDQAFALRDAVNEHLDTRQDAAKFELTDPIKIKKVTGEAGDVRLEYDDVPNSKPSRLPFLFNVYKQDDRFRAVAMNPAIAGMARQLLDAKRVLLFEDNVVVKAPRDGNIPFHQDYSYWPLATPSAVTVWIALDHIGPANGAMQMVPGSQRYGERLPVSFGDGKHIMGDEWPGVPRVPSDPLAEGHGVDDYELQPGECGFHDAMVWHGSPINDSDTRRSIYALRYMVDGTVWLGGVRMAYDDVGCAPGKPVGPQHFPLVQSAF